MSCVRDAHFGGAQDVVVVDAAMCVGDKTACVCVRACESHGHDLSNSISEISCCVPLKMCADDELDEVSF